MKLVSVIMPVYNGESFISEAIKSILAQSYNNFELIIIDDFSKDNTIKIIENYINKDRRIKYFINSNHKGIVGALNTGLEKSKGEYIARADSDDINLKNRFLKQVEFLNHNKDFMLVGGGYAVFNENGKYIKIFHPSLPIEIAWNFVSNTFFAHPTVMFRKELVYEFGLYPDEEAEDFAYFSSIVHKYKCANLDTILVEYREHNLNYSFVYSKEINKSVQNTFKKNFFYYTGSLDNTDIFFNYQRFKKVQFQNISKLILLNYCIINKILHDYNLSFISIQNIKFIIKLYINIFIFPLTKLYAIIKNRIKQIISDNNIK